MTNPAAPDRFRCSVLSKSLMLALGTLSLAHVQAQTSAGAPASAAEAPALQRVEITGSNIRRVKAETAAPVQTITREELDKSGKASVAEYLQTLAVDNAGSVPMSFGSGFAGGASGISLRGLGVASTLVLVNKRRVAPYGLADDGQKIFADLNTIPLEVVERIEVLKDGASAIYGSDAIAGVVNIVLKQSYVGTAAKVSYGQSRYGDGAEKKASFTHGFGDKEENGFNMFMNLEVGRTGQIYNRDRSGRGQVGKSDGRAIGFDATGSIGGVGAGGTGAITGPNTATGSPIGNVRNPATNNYYGRGNTGPGTDFTRTFPGAACNSNIPQGDPGGACLIDASQAYGLVQPKQENVNFFTRATKTIDANNELYAEVGIYKGSSASQTTPSQINGSTGYPGGPVSNAAIALGPNHPDNPYFGSEARLRYLPTDVGPRSSNIDSSFGRYLVGAKGTVGAWDYDTGLLYSRSKVTNERSGYLQRDVAFALLNPTAANVAIARANSPAYAALPPGSFWRIGENVGLNSPALYSALSPTISSEGVTQLTQIDFKATREFGQLPGGPIGVAVGTELRREETRLSPTTGTDTGNIIGLGYSAYEGKRNVFGLYGEALFPVMKQLEITTAARYDRYTDVGGSFTPKIGGKWTPFNEFAVRGSYAKGFRAPGAAENGKGGIASFANVSDPVRCAAGVATACSPLQASLITSPNPDLQPEKSTSTSLGFVWDFTPKSSISVDVWQVKRKNEINQETLDAAVAAGHVVRDPSTAANAADPGQITAVLANYVNSAQTTVRGVDVDGRHRWDLGSGMGKLTFDAKWTHLFSWLRVEQDGTRSQYAGTHGNCDITNCIGTVKDRVNFGVTWELNRLRVTAITNYRGSLRNILSGSAGECASHYANGDDAPGGCKVSSFTTVDLGIRYKTTDQLEIFGGIRNLFDKKPPFDPLTYGATGYNPLDYSGAVGRYFSVGLRYAFK